LAKSKNTRISQSECFKFTYATKYSTSVSATYICVFDSESMTTSILSAPCWHALMAKTFGSAKINVLMGPILDLSIPIDSEQQHNTQQQNNTIFVTSAALNTMADDLIAHVKEKEEMKNPAGVSECLVDYQRRMHPVGLGRADSLRDISGELVREVLPKAIPCKVSFARPGFNQELPGYGQGGFIRQEAIQRSPGETSVERYSVFPITAKHNLRQVIIKGHLHAVVAAKLAQPSVGKATLEDSPDFSWLPSGNESINLRPDGGRAAICSWGFDLSVGGLIASVEVDFTKPFYSFSLVRENFTLKVGQKVGIAVLFTEQTKPNKFTIAGCGEEEILITEDKIREIYGEPNQVNIYTGEITYVGASHIEYSFNSFTGCSGAVVFLLDQNQPESVQSCDFGHAVAIHSGAHPFLQNRNYGFAIRNHPAFAAV
jgi:hypothetical protein